MDEQIADSQMTVEMDAGWTALEQPGSDLESAIELEHRIALEAEQIRGDATKLDPSLFMRLWPLLKRPIPSAYVQTVGPVTGKPYSSTGIRSVQVQIDRMNNVLTPLWWGWTDSYFDQGKLCLVTAWVGNPTGFPVDVQRWQDETPERIDDGILLTRSSYGGVDRGSTVGNVYKGSFTNAAKRAFAALGPGHEIYLGTADLDPDVSTELAGETEGGGKELAEELWKQTVKLGLQDQLRLAASHVKGSDIGDCGVKRHALANLGKLSIPEMQRLNDWLNRKADQMAEGENQ